VSCYYFQLRHFTNNALYQGLITSVGGGTVNQNRSGFNTCTASSSNVTCTCTCSRRSPSVLQTGSTRTRIFYASQRACLDYFPTFHHALHEMKHLEVKHWTVRVHNSPPLAPILSQMHPVHTFPPCFTKIHSNIILPSTPKFSSGLTFCEVQGWVTNYSGNSPPFMEPKVHYCVHKSPPLAPILSQMHPVHTFSSYFTNINCNTVLSSNLRLVFRVVLLWEDQGWVTNYMRRILQKLIVTQLVKKFSVFLEPEGSLPCS
jgi:hypothetical protein